jgi:hypothetical protein
MHPIGIKFKVILLVLKGSDNGVLRSGLLKFWPCSIISATDSDQLFLTDSFQQKSLHLSERIGKHIQFLKHCILSEHETVNKGQELSNREIKSKLERFQTAEYS